MNLKFKSSKKELPKDEQYILHIKADRSMYYEDSPLPTFSKCEWSWSDGDGGQLVHSDEYSLESPPEEFPFLWILDGEGYIIWSNETNPGNPDVEHFWWMDQEEFDKIWKNSRH